MEILCPHFYTNTKGFYNKNRLQSSLNYVLPEVFERSYFENVS
ncbi:MAG: hypothetical protein ACRC0Y_10135 [Fusobacteriaceae bacterium]